MLGIGHILVILPITRKSGQWFIKLIMLTIFSFIAAFIQDKQKLAKFPGLKITYKKGSDPYIYLQNSEKTTVETLAIDKWNTDSVDEFFMDHMELSN